MKVKVTKGFVVDIIMGILAQLFFLFPWIQTDNGNYAGIFYLLRNLFGSHYKDGFRADFPRVTALMTDSVDSLATQFHVTVILMLFIQIIAVISLIQSIMGRQSGYYSVVGTIVSIIMAIVWSADIMGYGEFFVANNEVIPLFTYIYPYTVIAVNIIWFGVRRVTAELDDAVKKQRLERAE